MKINSKTTTRRRSIVRGVHIILALLFLMSPCRAEDTASLAAVIKISGEVQWLERDKEDWMPAEAGLVLNSGDKLRTAVGANVAVMFLDDRSLLKLAEKTEVTFNATREGGTVSKRILMSAGQLWAKVTKAESPHFQVETPTSVAAVKGSEFYDIEDIVGGNTLHAITGRYDYGNEFGSVELTAGQTGTSDGKSPPGKRSTRPDELPGFGGGLQAYGGQDQTIRVEFIDEEGRERILIIPLIRPGNQD
ncbi:MAG: FecR domain-containing protein [bacterium]|nr:FecR domain-containing protein [bacterium]